MPTISFDQVKLSNLCVELRYVVTPDLDGRQLQYRAWGGGQALSEWLPVHTVFVNKKLEETNEQG